MPARRMLLMVAALLPLAVSAGEPTAAPARSFIFKESAETKNRAAGDLLRVRAKFRIPLEAYGIQRTEALLLKVAEVAEVSVDAWGSTQFKL